MKNYSKKYYLSHREELIKLEKEYRLKHVDKIKARGQSYRDTHKKEISLHNKARNLITKDSRRIAHANLRAEVLAHYGGSKCVCCGETIQEFLAIDHINGGGNAHRKQIGRGNTYKWLKNNNFPPGFQVMCHNCNMAKAFYGECPHQRNKNK